MTPQADTTSTPRDGSKTSGILDINKLAQDLYYAPVKQQQDYAALMKYAWLEDDMMPKLQRLEEPMKPYDPSELREGASALGWEMDENVPGILKFTRRRTDDTTEEIHLKTYFVHVPTGTSHVSKYQMFTAQTLDRLTEQAMIQDGVMLAPDTPPGSLFSDPGKIIDYNPSPGWYAPPGQIHYSTDTLPLPPYWQKPKVQPQFPGGITQEAIDKMMKSMLKQCG